MMFHLRLSCVVIYLFVCFCKSFSESGGVCGDGFLPCDNGECILREGWCDKKPNCSDKSDEAYCKEKSRWDFFWNSKCKDIHFECVNGICIPKSAFCDGTQDCNDGSDEYLWECEEKTDAPETIVSSSKTQGSENEENFTYAEELVSTISENSISTLDASTLLHSKASTSDLEKSGSNGKSVSSSIDYYRAPSSSTATFGAPYISISTSKLSYSTPTSTIGGGLSTQLQNATQIRIIQPHYKATTKSTRHHFLSTTSSQTDHFYFSPSRPQYYPRSTRSQQYSRSTRPHYYASSTRSQQYSRSTRPQYYPSSTRSQQYSRSTRPQYYPSSTSAEQNLRPTRPQYHHSSTRSQQYYRSIRPPYYISSTRPPQYPRSTRPQYQNPTPLRSHSYYYTPTRRTTIRNQYPHDYSSPTVNRDPNQQLTYRYPLSSQHASINQDYWNGGHDISSHHVVNGQQQPYSNGGRTIRRKFSSQRIAPLFRFFFEKNYALTFGKNNTQQIRSGQEWILEMMDSSGGWGRDTPRALIALSLVNNSFANGNHENDLMQKYLSVYLGTNLFRETKSLNKLAQYVHALIATCLDPRDFHSLDLTELIQNNILEHHRSRRNGEIHPLVYLSLCLAGRELTHFEVHDLMTKLAVPSTEGEQQRDWLSFSIMAFSCHMQQETSKDLSYQSSLLTLLSNATSQLLKNMKNDGSFGSIYGTSLAAQALLSVNDSRNWNPNLTLNYLKKQQKEDGSFGDFLATYLTLPVLAGRSLLYLRNTQCNNLHALDSDLTVSEIMDFSGQKFHVQYSLYFGYPLENTYSIQVLVPEGISFYDVMRVAADQNNYFKFFSEEKDGLVNIYSISNTPNDAERDLAWHLYIKQNSNTDQNHPKYQESYVSDIKELHPKPYQHFIYWYHPTNVF